MLMSGWEVVERRTWVRPRMLFDILALCSMPLAPVRHGRPAR